MYYFGEAVLVVVFSFLFIISYLTRVDQSMINTFLSSGIQACTILSGGVQTVTDISLIGTDCEVFVIHYTCPISQM